MFDQKEIVAYRKISAPADLRDKVLSSCADIAPKKRNPHPYMKWISSVAACFVLAMFLGVFAAGKYGAVSVSLSGSDLAKEQSVVYIPNNGVQGISLYREREETVIPLAFNGHAELSVSDGVMNIMTDSADEVLYSGTEYSMDGKTLVHWTVCADDTAHIFEMTIVGAFQTETIILTYDESQNEWTITRHRVE